MENDFVPIDDNPNNTDKIEREFEPIDDTDLNQKLNFNSPPNKLRRIEEVTQPEEKKSVIEKSDTNFKDKRRRDGC